MSEPERGQTSTTPKDTATGSGDDERENREQIKETGEPKTDSLGNADGAS